MSRENELFRCDPTIRYFECLRCGDCCITSDIPITIFDVFRLTKSLKKKTGEVITKLCRLGFHPFPKNGIITKDMLGVVFIFKEKPCIFLSNETIPTCTIYDIRPIVCENTPNPFNPLSISHMHSTCQGLQTSYTFPESLRDYYKQINKLHARMLSLTARFFYDTFEWGQPLSDLSARFGETPDTIITPNGEKYTYEIIEMIEKPLFEHLQKHYDIIQETIRGLNINYETLKYDLKEIISKTATSEQIKRRFLNQIDF